MVLFGFTPTMVPEALKAEGIRSRGRNIFLFPCRYGADRGRVASLALTKTVCQLSLGLLQLAQHGAVEALEDMTDLLRLFLLVLLSKEQSAGKQQQWSKRYDSFSHATRVEGSTANLQCLFEDGNV